MSVNRHRVRITSIPKGVRVYYWDYFGYLPHYFFLNNDGKQINPDVVFDESYGSIYNSQIRDSYKNRDCNHSYLEFECLVGQHNLPGYRTTLTNQSSPIRNCFYANGVVTSTLVPGTGLTSNNWYVKVISNSADIYVAEHYYLGKLATVETITIVKQPRFIYPDSMSGRTMTYYQVVVPTSWYSSNYGATKSAGTYSIAVNAKYLGTSSLSGYEPLLSREKLNEIFSSLYKPSVIEHTVPDSLTDDIFSRLTIPDVNNVENLKDFKQIRKSLVPLTRMLKKRSFKSLAELYLWYKYTYRTTELDLKSYFEFFQKWKKDSLNKSDVKRIHLHYTDYSNNDGRQDTQYSIKFNTYNCGILEALGLDINLSNTWDTLPFSFVVDWFIGIGDLLARLDHEDTVSKMNINTVIATTKRSKIYYPLASFGYDAPCTFIIYQRTISQSVPTGPISLSSKNPFNHVVEGAALITCLKGH